MSRFEAISENIYQAETQQDIERIDRITNALAAEALGYSHVTFDELDFGPEEFEDDEPTIIRSNN